MRAIVSAAVLAVALVGSASADPLPAAYQPGAFPRDETSLRDLDSQQLRIVRRAGAQCWHSLEGGFRSRSATRARLRHQPDRERGTQFRERAASGVSQRAAVHGAVQ